jgi:hypothetical protein
LVISALFVITIIGNNPDVLQWIKGHIHAVDYDSSIKLSKKLIHTTLMNMQGPKLSEK